MFIFLELTPKIALSKAANWETVNCVVTEAVGGQKHGWRGVFQYGIGGANYSSTRLSFWPGNISQRIVIGDQHSGKYNPNDFTDVVLLPDYTPNKYLSLLIYSWVLLSGLAFILYTLVIANIIPMKIRFDSNEKTYYKDM